MDSSTRRSRIHPEYWSSGWSGRAATSLPLSQRIAPWSRSKTRSKKEEGSAPRRDLALVVGVVGVDDVNERSGAVVAFDEESGKVVHRHSALAPRAADIADYAPAAAERPLKPAAVLPGPQRLRRAVEALDHLVHRLHRLSQ